MYSERYPSLYKAFPFDNFEVIVETIEKYFGSLFNLQILEHELRLNNHSGSYVSFFTKIAKQLQAKPTNDLFTVEQISLKISSILHTDNAVRDCFLKQLVFVPSFYGEPSAQLGFQEKLATGRLKVPEPVTFLDMLRITHFLQKLGNRMGGGTSKSIAVINLASTQEEEFKTLREKNSPTMINLNLNPKETPKWAVIRFSNKTPSIYCENPLSENERRELEKKLGAPVTEVSEGKANNLISTGYSAVAWLDQNITRGWNFDTNADFNVLFGDFALTIFQADAGGVHFECVNNEYVEYFTEELQKINAKAYGEVKDPKPGSQKWGSFSLFRMVGFTTINAIEGEPVPYNDLAKVIEIVGRHNLSAKQFESYSGLGFRSNIPRFAHTLTKLNFLQEELNQVTLNIPTNINHATLLYQHQQSCLATNTDHSLIRFINRDPVAKSAIEEDMAATMVLTLFRARAKKAVLSINLPQRFNLNADEQQMVVSLMQNNAFVTELHINEDNQSLQTLKAELLPVLARNRWLAANNYLPPLVDNYWQRAAKYWLTHLNEYDDILSNKQEHDLFKRCVEEMGIRGLKAVLAYLKDPEASERLLREYGLKQPVFYLACQPAEVDDYLQLVITHLQHGSSFPFAQLGLAYQPASDLKYIELLSYVNKKDSFEVVQLTDCLRHKEAFATFLQRLSTEAKKEAWTGLIIIPELDDTNSVGEEYRKLRALYRQLNNVILHNRHLKQGAQLALSIKEVSQFDDIEPGKEKQGKDPKTHQDAHEPVALPLGEDGKGPWPLQRGGAVQLQLQQQQEIQQSRQVQQEQQKMQMLMLDEVISSELVTYDSIDKLLTNYYERFISENEFDTNHAALWAQEDESLLQGFFHTWINANPQVRAPQIIQSMTQEAAKMLLRHHSRVTSGLHLDNLPKGFYTQRSKNGGLILCYDPEVGFGNGFISPLTPLMTVNRPIAETWEGDFRFLDVEYYLHNEKELKEAADFQDLLLFEFLQPKRDYQAHFDRFCEENPAIALLIEDHKNKVLAHWLVFLQAWQYQSAEGVEAFLKLQEEELILSNDVACDKLFSKQAPKLVEWAKRIDMDEQTLRAIGQVYYHQGDEVIALLLTKLQQLETALGEPFFLAFKRVLLNRSDNFNSFVNPAFFSAIDSLITRLTPVKMQGNRDAFLSICALHLDCVLWEATETLWNAFDYFIKELTDMELELSGDEFQGLVAQNMLVGLDRILATLRNLPGQNERERFLKSLATLDLTQGGVHYAVQQEHFKYFDNKLALHDFDSGTPTYSPDLTDLYDWAQEKSALNIQRTLASRTQFSHDDYCYLSKEFAEGDLAARNQFSCLLFTESDAAQTKQALTAIRALPPYLISIIGHHLHQAVFHYGHDDIVVSLKTVMQFQELLTSERGVELLERYPHGNFLEALSILVESEREDSLEDVLVLFEAEKKKEANYPDFLFHDAYKLATLFGASTTAQLNAFITATSHLKRAVQQEMHLLIKHLLSVNYISSDKNALTLADNWNDLIKYAEEANAKPAKRTVLRHAFIETLTERGLAFKYSKSGHFRKLVQADYPPTLNVFTDHQQRMWSFLKNHIVVPANGDAQEALQPLLAFFQRLQLNRTYLNEIEPLLAILEKTVNEEVWSANYFSQMITVLKPDNDQVSFPFDMLQVMLKDDVLSAKPIDNTENDFPKGLVIPLKGILSNHTFNRSQQAKLCQLALKEYYQTKTNPLLNDTITLLAVDNRVGTRDDALQSLLTCTNNDELSNRLDKLKKLLNHPRGSDIINQQWENTAALWIKAITKSHNEELLFSSVINCLLDDQADRRAKLLHIIAWSSLDKGLRSTQDYLDELQNKAPKLVSRLLRLSEENLNLLAACYPKQPAPGTSNILRLLKKHQNGQEFSHALHDFLTNPHPEIRVDYQQVAKTRQADLQRMLMETRLIDGESSNVLTSPQMGRISVIFSQLKLLESKVIFVEGANKAVSAMSQEELAEAFHRLSRESVHRGQDDMLQAQIWALLFEALGRTSRKYPHMAQQFALIANDIVVTAPTRVLQLATGEGKSHFVALRAARHAAQGKVVDVCTAKRSLAQRDLEDYQDLFKYLNLTATYIEPKSPREAYLDGENAQARIHYTTLGDLSLFLDEQSFQGRAINIDPKQRVGLGDELDFIYFDEGRKTEYNYARPTGRTPKQMMWFYQAVNAFYLENKENLNSTQITPESVEALITFLREKAAEDETKEKFLANLARDGLQLVRWLQSAHEAHQLEKGVGFTVREENVQVGDAAYLLKEVIPLSSDNQKMTGSTFSAGVHQLLAVRLNTEARERGESQNYHVHAESHIISSQIAAKHMRMLWGNWEGFTGTISPAQAYSLHRAQGTQVLQVSTNQRDLRFWHSPNFHPSQAARIRAMIKQLRQCLDQKQSILFSCKNDQQVLWLKEILEKELLPPERKKLIFYTNEDEESSSDILNNKHVQENWHGGKKQQAVGLVASGFGRGDNVGVEAVFLFDVNDINDLKQKGGRTARNGEEGEVFQFYLTTEMEDEKNRLLASIKNSPGVNMDELNESLDKVDGKSADENRFNHIMLLREYVFNLQNAANQGYRSGVAQFSSWGMSLIGAFLDPSQALEFTGQLTSAMRQLEKQWLTISSKEELTPTEKVRQIEAAITKCHLDLWQDYQGVIKGKSLEVSDFKLYPFPDIILSLPVLTEEDIPEGRQDVVSLCALLASLSSTASEQKLLSGFSEKLLFLAADPDALREFTQDAGQWGSVGQFMDQLNIRVAQLTNPSPDYENTRKEALVTPTNKTLFKAIKSEVKESFLAAMKKLTPSLQQGLDEWLKKPGFANAEARIKKALPLASYLASFSESEQEHWGADYLYQFDTLWHHTPAESLAPRLSGLPMSYSDNNILWNLATHNAVDNKEDTFLSLQQSLKGDTAILRMRMLTRCEGLISQLSADQRTLFLNAFTKVMAQFQEGRDWDIFVELTDKTARWWNANDRAHQPNLIMLWQQLAERELPLMTTVIEKSLHQSGKNWFQMLELSMSLSAVNANQLTASHLQVLHNILIKKQGEQALGNHFTLESRQLVLARLNSLLNTWSNKSDFTQRATDSFNTYSLFLHQLITEGATNLSAEACWYLDCLRQMPEVRNSIDILRASPHRNLALVHVVGELTQDQFTSEQATALLRVAEEGSLDNDVFSLCCQTMATIAKILADTPLLSEKEKTDFNNQIQSLPADKLVGLFKGMKNYPEQLKANPRVLTALLRYANTEHIDATRVEQLSTTLLQVAGISTQAPNYLKHLIKGVDRFQDTTFSKADMKRLLIVLSGDDALPAEQVLFDNVASHLESNVRPGQQQAVKTTIDLFYRLAKTHRGNVERMFHFPDSPELKEMFNFKQQREALRTQRVIWMHLLNHNAFVTGSHKSKELDAHVFQWSSTQNQDMLQRGFDLYLAETQLLLAQKPKARLKSGRDLSIIQQRGLLNLADELAIIGKPQLCSTVFADLKGVTQGLKKLENNYQAGWFKSTSRKAQFTQLQQEVNFALARNPGNSSLSRYESVLTIIREARLNAMQADLTTNKLRTFLLNRGGHSRYFNTLNQMEDLLVRHWVKDVNAVQQFQNYSTLCQEDLLAMTDQLYQALKTQDEKNQHAHLERQRKFGPRMAGWFDNKERTSLQTLCDSLFLFNDQNTHETLTSNTLAEIATHLKKESSKLPGHLQTLAREVLLRSDALISHLEEKTHHPAKPILR